MNAVALIGIDIGKRSFHLHAQDEVGYAIWKRKVTRAQLLRSLAQQPPCRIVMEACAGAHWLARALGSFGHNVELIAARFVRPFVKNNKHDFADAEAICEASRRPNMRYVAVKTVEQQTLSMRHRLRESLVRERTAVTNQIHGFLLEFGVSLPTGSASLKRLDGFLQDEPRLPPIPLSLIGRLRDRYRALSEELATVDRELKDELAANDAGQRLLTIPGIGVVTASLLAAEAGDARAYRCSRDFAASIGLVPRQYSTGGKPKLLGISKRGDRHLRTLLIQGARAIMVRTPGRTDQLSRWVNDLRRRRHSNIVACALANKLARIVWAVLRYRTRYCQDFAGT
jgi:transposase